MLSLIRDPARARAQWRGRRATRCSAGPGVGARSLIYYFDVSDGMVARAAWRATSPRPRCRPARARDRGPVARSCAPAWLSVLALVALWLTRLIHGALSA